MPTIFKIYCKIIITGITCLFVDWMNVVKAILIGWQRSSDMACSGIHPSVESLTTPYLSSIICLFYIIRCNNKFLCLLITYKFGLSFYSMTLRRKEKLWLLCHSVSLITPYQCRSLPTVTSNNNFESVVNMLLWYEKFSFNHT